MPLLWLLSFLLLSCTSPSTKTLEYEGEDGLPVPITLESYTPEVEFTMDTTSALFVADTGSPVQLADASFFSLPPGVHEKEVTVFGFTFLHLPVLFEDWIEDSAPIQGLVGAELLQHFYWELDYPNQTTTLYAEVFPSPDPQDVEIPFELKGGGRFRLSTGDTFSVGATRHLIWCTVEGEEILAMIDTGASYMVASESLMELLGGLQGRPDHGTLEMITVNGTVQAPLTALQEVAFSHAPSTLVEDVEVSVLPDSFFSELYLETGKRLDLFVGGAYLRHFRLRFDYNKKRLYVSPPRAKKGAAKALPGRARLPLMLEQE